MVEKVPTEENEVSSVEADMECPNQKPPENPDTDVS
jgi:heat shock protein